MWQPEAIYAAANAALAAAHLAAAGVFGWFGYCRRNSRVVRLLFWPLAVFFGTGVLTHILNVWDGDGAATAARAWAFVARAALTCAVIAPITWRGVKATALLPAKEEYQRVLAAKDMAAAAARVLFEERAAAVADRDYLIARMGERARAVDAECTRLRDELNHKKWQTLTEADIAALRGTIHAIRNAAS
jgi:hypothetical protein